MMGRRGDGQGQFFYSFDLDEVVPADHLVRQIDAVHRSRHLHIGENDIRAAACGKILAGFVRVMSLDDPESRFPKLISKAVANEKFVLDNENTRLFSLQRWD